MAYTYLACDAVTFDVIDELPLQGVSFGTVLNGAGSFDGGVLLDGELAPPDSAWEVVDSARVDRILDASIPGRTALFVDRDGVLVWGGLIWARRYEDGKLTVQGNELWSYARRRYLTGFFGQTATDQGTIASALVNNALTGLFGVGHPIGMIVGSATVTGVIRDRSYDRGKEIGEAVEQLAAVRDGFDFAVDLAYAAGAPTATFRTYYPRKGRDYGDTGLVFELGVNLVGYTEDEDATRQTTRPLALGEGEGLTQLWSENEATDILAEGWPILESVDARSDVKEQATLDNITATQADVFGYPVELWSATVRADLDPVLGSWDDGDTARFVTRDARHPSGYDGFHRIVGHTVTPGDGDTAEVVKLTLTGAI